MISISQVRNGVIDELSRFNERFESVLSHDDFLLNEVLKLIASRKGKQMRPLLTLLSAKVFGEVNDHTLLSAVSLELMHTASLIHDDVVDESDERRGLLSVHKAYSNKVAVLSGDYLLGLALKNVAMTGSTELMDLFSVTAQHLAQGELLQLDTNSKNLSYDYYMDVIKNKTAVLFSACAKAGGMSVGCDNAILEQLSRVGEYIGICFQIKDDIFDYNPHSEIGKPTGNDMKEGKVTLPALYALKQMDSKDFNDIARLIQQGQANKLDIEKMRVLTLEQGGIEYAYSVIKDFADKAHQIIDCFPDNRVKASLHDYVVFVCDRAN
ncbi:MAG: polyprenyl synthetase family protein [Bacteroidaceae bacterium]|nr:polyprenyl synthetase family protein [Bacteroidaceae bacterium]